MPENLAGNLIWRIGGFVNAPPIYIPPIFHLVGGVWKLLTTSVRGECEASFEDGVVHVLYQRAPDMPYERAQIGKFAAEHGPAKAVRHFSKLLSRKVKLSIHSSASIFPLDRLNVRTGWSVQVTYTLHAWQLRMTSLLAKTKPPN